VASSTDKNLLQRLQNSIPRESPFDTRVLKELGISPALANYYVRSGWIARLGRGAFSFPNISLEKNFSIKLLSKSITGLHVGGKTALAWQGFRHNIPARERIVLWGNKRGRLPEWFVRKFLSRYVSKQLFDSGLPGDFALHPLLERPDGPLVSAPERALLELLAEIGQAEEVEESRNIFQMLVGLRVEVLSPLLQHCTRVKVTRLCVKWAADLGLPWTDAARDAAQGRLGKGRWSGKLQDGSTLNLPA
jgi:Transcriptional regulator, AbiEi antitoxin, Type IV TA system/Transcriptional regulator, AbiEi antitoxin N-terminal domain